MKKPEIGNQLDLHGNIVEEALPKVDDFLYAAFQALPGKIFLQR
ncbi:MAG: Smr/MutS family protein [Dehalococcoidales bacterium]|nr:Smr/MutS family protein [Dehalococcoidales bacterium]